MIYLNGKYIFQQEAKIEINDRGFLLSDGIFETMRAYNGKIHCLSDHYYRFKKSADYLAIPFTLSLQEFENITNKLLCENKLENKDASLRITLTRGTAPRGLLPPSNANPTLMGVAFPLTPTVLKPLNVVVSPIRRNEFSPLANMKSLCYLDNIIARSEAAKQGADDCILLNTKKNVACSSVANIFIVTEKGVITPKLEDGVLPGITRKTVIDICKANNFSVFEETFSESDLMKAKEVFFTNRLVEIQPVVKINNVPINKGEVGAVVLMLQKLYKNNITQFLNNSQQPTNFENKNNYLKSKI